MFHGKHFDFGPVMSFPKPVQKSGIPIHIGGHSRLRHSIQGRLGDGFSPDCRRNSETEGVVRR